MRACMWMCTRAYVHVCIIVLLAENWVLGMTVVPEENKIYYADFDDNSIDVLSLKTRKITVLINQLDEPRGFALYKDLG